MRYRKKPVVIDAEQLTQENAGRVASWAGAQVIQQTNAGMLMPVIGLTIPTLEGDHHVAVGDWVIRGIKGEFYPCRDDIFEATYEAVEE